MFTVKPFRLINGGQAIIYPVRKNNWDFAAARSAEEDKERGGRPAMARMKRLLPRLSTTKNVLLTINMKRQRSLWSISNIITWYTFVLAIVLRPLYIVNGVLTANTVFDDSCVIQREYVP